MKYLDTTRVDIHYELPLNEIIYDFSTPSNPEQKATQALIMK